MKIATIINPIIIIAITILSFHKSTAHTLDSDTFLLKGHPNLEAESTALTKSEEEYLRKFKIIRIAITEPNFHPYDIADKESQYYQGISADFLQLIKDSLHTQVEIIRFKVREDAINAVKNGDVDLLTTANSYEEYNGLKLSIPYISDRPALFKNTSLNAEVKTISMAYDYLADKVVKEYFPNKTIINYPTKQAAVAAAAFGKTDAVIMDLSSANYMINNTFYKRLQLDDYLHIDSKGIAFAASDTNDMLLEILNKAIKTISKDESRLIRKRWSGGGYIIPEKSELPIFNEEEKNWIKRNGKINVVFNEYMAPLSYLNSSGRPAGYAIEILELLRLYSGLDIDYTSSKDFNEQQELVLKSKTPYITILTPNKNRAIFFDFSSEFSSSPYIIVQRKNNVEINDPIIAIPRDHAIEEYTRQYIKFKEIKLTSNFIEALDTVKNSEADYTIIPLNIADYYNHGYFDDILEVKELVEKIPTAAANFAVKKEEHILVDIINKTLLSIPPNELQTLENYWRSNSLPAKQTWKDYRYTIYTILISSLILILVSIGWTLYTRQHYRQRLKATKALDGQLLFMQQIVDAIPHPIYVRNKRRELTMCNESYLRTFNSSREELLQKTTIEGTIRAIEAPLVDKEYIQALEDGIPIFKDRELHIDGVKYNIYHWFKSYGDDAGNIEGIIGGWIDVSDRVKLIKELENAKEVADTASQAKSTFLATMSHEIRTPMNAIIGMLELALKSPNLPVSVLNTIKVAYDSANGLLELIGDILDIARIEAGQLTLSPVRTNLKSIVTSVVRVFEGLAHQKGLSLELNFDTHIKNDVLVDPMRIKQILSNLIGNSIKFTEVGSVKISVSCANLSNSQCCFIFTVIDTGIGISPEDQLKLFMPFSQGHESHNKYGGTGLGLMICRSLCEMMGGTLELKSQLNSGTEIRMELRLNLLEELPKIAETQIIDHHKEEQSYNILIVDDHPANRLLLAQQLKFLGHNVIESDNGKSAIDLFKENEIQYIITDCNMPEMDGYEFCKNIRNIEKHYSKIAPIIIGYTANAQKEVKEACLKAGMNNCLFKPISLQELSDALLIHNQVYNSDISEISFSPDVVNNLTGNNKELIIKLLTELTKSNKSDKETLIQAKKGMDYQRIKDIAHKIKGAARIIDAKRLVACCEILEQSSHNSLENDFLLLIDTLEKLDNEISDYIEKNNSIE